MDKTPFKYSIEQGNALRAEEERMNEEYERIAEREKKNKLRCQELEKELEKLNKEAFDLHVRWGEIRRRTRDLKQQLEHLKK